MMLPAAYTGRAKRESGGEAAWAAARAASGSAAAHTTAAVVKTCLQGSTLKSQVSTPDSIVGAELARLARDHRRAGRVRLIWRAEQATAPTHGNPIKT